MAKTRQKSRGFGTSQNEETLFFRNIKYFHFQSGLDKGEFLKRSGINSVNMWQRYAKGALPRGSTLRNFTSALNSVIAEIPALHMMLPDGITDSALLMEVDLAEHLREGKPVVFSPRELSFTPAACAAKFLGTYIVYYPSPKEPSDNEPLLSYGVICITEDGKSDRRLMCRGFFNISDYPRAEEQFVKLSTCDAGKLDATIAHMKSGALAERYYEGELILGENFFWITMKAVTHAEFLSASFDMDIKMLYRDPEKIFAGTRGIALSRVAGAGDSRSAAFPLIISKHALNENENIAQVNYYLNLSYNRPDEKVAEAVTENILKTLETLDSVPDSHNLKRLYLNDVIKRTCLDSTRFVAARSASLDKTTTANCYENLLKRK